VWWVCGGLLLVFGALLAYPIYLRRARFVADRNLLAQLAESKIEPGDDRPLDPKLWPQWRGLRRDGVTTAPDLLIQWPSSGPKELWRVKGGDGYSAFAVAGGLAYSMVALNNGREAVLAWDVETGKVRWRHTWEAGQSFDYGGPRATPTVADGLLYTVSPAGRLMCLAASTGKPKWQVDLVEEVGARPPKWGLAFSPLVEDGLVYTMPGGRNGHCLAAFDAKTGQLAWASQDDPAGYSSPLVATLAGMRQVVFFTGRRLLGVTPKEGTLLWEFPWPTSFEVNAATPVVVRATGAEGQSDYLFITSGYGKGCALVQVAGEGKALRARAVYESNELCCHFASPVLHDGHLYALDETRDLTCLDVRTGEVRWRHKGFRKGSLIRVDDRLVVLGEDGRLALVACDPQGYREVARARPFRQRCWTLPVLADGRLFLRDQQEVVCLGVRKR
jgi:outer membrane protein assembly factor BamB